MALSSGALVYFNVILFLPKCSQIYLLVSFEYFWGHSR